MSGGIRFCWLIVGRACGGWLVGVVEEGGLGLDSESQGLGKGGNRETTKNREVQAPCTLLSLTLSLVGQWLVKSTSFRQGITAGPIAFAHHHL